MSLKRARFDADEWRVCLRRWEERILAQVQHEWLLAPSTPFHTWVSCITAQRIAFAASSAVRAYIYSLHTSEGDGTVFTVERMSRMSELEWKHCRTLGLSVQQVDVLVRFVAYCQAYKQPRATLDMHLTRDINRVRDQMSPGIGPWTCKAVQLSLSYATSTLFLGEDLHVRAQLQHLLPVSMPAITVAQANRLGSQFLQPGVMAMILWRAKRPAWATWTAAYHQDEDEEAAKEQSATPILQRQDFF
jgi:3-methyladenine DNA glycosylase/8-oxoguanine DNA glycosylase